MPEATPADACSPSIAGPRSDASDAGDAPKPERSTGLEGVVACDTALSRVEGTLGRLTVAGRLIEELVGTIGFERVVSDLWHLALGAEGRAADGTEEVRLALGEARVRAFARLSDLRAALDRDDAMSALRAAVAQLDARAPRTTRSIAAARAVAPLAAPPFAADLEASIELVGSAAVFVGAWARLRLRLDPVAPDPDAPHAADLLRGILGRASAPAQVEGLDAYLVTVAEHGLNASTFTARIVASTGADLVSATTAAIGALSGPLHGGAPGPVLDMLDAVGAPERADEWVAQELGARRRIMGMGHRIYRTRDPRAAVLERTVERLEHVALADRSVAGLRARERLRLARAVEAAAVRALSAAHPGRALRANVEFYTAVLLDALGVPRSLFSALFACARMAGWCAHVLEQRRTGRLIRPASRYVGPEPATGLG